MAIFKRKCQRAPQVNQQRRLDMVKCPSNPKYMTSFVISIQVIYSIHTAGGKNDKNNNPPVITIFIGGMVTLPSHGWFVALFYPD
jgi:hypothetical protein